MIRKILYLSCAVMLLGLNASYADETPATTQTNTPAIEVKAEKAVYPLNKCIVSDEELGHEGKPVVYDYNGREIQFCCKGCVKDFEKNPDKYIQKLDKAIIKAQTDSYPIKTCVVSGEKLGEMGTPVDYVYNNQLVRLCCKGCIKDFQKEPAKYLSKLSVVKSAEETH